MKSNQANVCRVMRTLLTHSIQIIRNLEFSTDDNTKLGKKKEMEREKRNRCHYVSMLSQPIIAYVYRHHKYVRGDGDRKYLRLPSISFQCKCMASISSVVGIFMKQPLNMHDIKLCLRQTQTEQLAYCRHQYEFSLKEKMKQKKNHIKKKNN